MANAYIERFEKTIKFKGIDAGIHRARTCLCSMTLGRNFGESDEDYLQRKPELRKMQDEIRNWIKHYAAY